MIKSNREAQISANLPTNELRMYEDRELTKPAEDITMPRSTLGQTYNFERYLKNHSDKNPFVNLELATDDPDITVTGLPQFLPPLGTAKITFKFTPSLSRREKLDVDNLIKGDMFIG